MDIFVNLAAIVVSFALVSAVSLQGQAALSRASEDRTLPFLAILLAFALGPVIVAEIGTSLFGALIGGYAFIGGLLGGAWAALKGTGAFKAIADWLRG